jgi:hypothetical protein
MRRVLPGAGRFQRQIQRLIISSFGILVEYGPKMQLSKSTQVGLISQRLLDTPSLSTIRMADQSGLPEVKSSALEQPVEQSHHEIKKASHSLQFSVISSCLLDVML